MYVVNILLKTYIKLNHVQFFAANDTYRRLIKAENGTVYVVLEGKEQTTQK